MPLGARFFCYLLFMLPFPYSFFILPIAMALGLAYLHMKGLGLWSYFGRGAIGAILCTLPFLTAGPGPAQIILGLGVGYLGLRMTALGQRSGLSGLKKNSRALLYLEPLFQPRAIPWSRPRGLVFLGILELAACVFLLWLGYMLRLWQGSWLGRFADNFLVFLEVAVGTAGLHHVFVGLAALRGHHLRGLQESPIHSTSLSEFWGKRWNRLVQALLAEGFFRPILRQGYPRLAWFTTFAASGIFHLLVLADGGPTAILVELALPILAFFLLNGTLVMLERRWGWHRCPHRSWQRWFAKARTLILLMLLSPLLLDPYARLASVHGRKVVPARKPVAIHAKAIAQASEWDPEECRVPR